MTAFSLGSRAKARETNAIRQSSFVERDREMEILLNRACKCAMAASHVTTRHCRSGMSHVTNRHDMVVVTCETDGRMGITNAGGGRAEYCRAGSN